MMNLTSPTLVRNWCREREFRPNRTLGQHFLIDRNILEALVDAAEIAPGMRVLEVGPGLGVVTRELLARGAEVVAVEKDRCLAAWLRESLGAERRLKLLAADVLALDADILLAPRFDVFVSNLPYSTGTRILLAVALHPRSPPRFTVMTQQEVADRLVAGPGGKDRGQPGVWVQRLFDVAVLRTVKPTCFWPRPEVLSAIVALLRHARHPLPPRSAARFQGLTRCAFMHRRKQLGSTFRHLPAPLALPEERQAELFAACGIDPRARPADLTVAAWCALAAAWTPVAGA